MKMSMEQKKEKMKEKLAKNVDQYFEELERVKKEETTDINDIERIWGDGLEWSNKIFAETIAEIFREETEDKKKLPKV